MSAAGPMDKQGQRGYAKQPAEAFGIMYLMRRFKPHTAQKLP